MEKGNRIGVRKLKRQIKDAIYGIIKTLKQDQTSNGSWNYGFETGISTDCYMIILLRSLEIHDENLIRQLTERIISKQENNGAWKLFYDEQEGNISATLEAYYALLYSGHIHIEDKRLEIAKQFILEKGGIEETHMFTKLMLAITGQYKWPAFFPIPIETILLPTSFPINFYSFSVYGRANLTPIMLLADKQYHIKTEKSPDLTDLFVHRRGPSFDLEDTVETRSFLTLLEKGINSLVGLPYRIHKLAIEHAKQYMLNHIEPDGTFFNYFSSTFLMIFALLSQGYSKTHPTILNAVNGLKQMKGRINGFSHMQYTTATVWNTSLINYALQEARVSPLEPMVKKANHYLQSRQHIKYGDWVVHNPSGLPGGWGFSDSNTINPDIDDTTASLRSIARSVYTDKNLQKAWEKGVQWVLSMQNDDGGFSSFEKNKDSQILKKFPIEKAEYILLDSSTPDLTGRTLEFLGSYTNLEKKHSSIRLAIKWLMENQMKDGSWYGRWGICYIYGTWAAVTGLCSVGVSPTHHSVSKAVAWLNAIQNHDGGWGESCRSDSQKRYVPLKVSTLTHTAWALDALIAASDKATESIDKGMNYLLANLHKQDWTVQYPKGQGMAGDFYIHYHSYRYIFPLLTFAHYQRKYFTE